MITPNQFQSFLEFCRGNASAAFEANEAMLSFIKSAGLSPWLYHYIQTHACAHLFPEAFVHELKKAYMGTMIRNRQIFSVWQEVQAILLAHGIEVVALKGCALAFTVYPDEAIRPMGDLDVLVREGQAKQARQLLVDKGAEQRYVPISEVHDQVHAHVSSITYKGILVEVHQRLYALGDPLNPPVEPLFNSRVTIPVGSSSVTVLSDTWFVYHLATHALHGYRLGGMRLGWLFDIGYLLNRHASDVDVFVQQVLDINPSVAHDVKKMLNWALMLMSHHQEILVPWDNFPSLEYFNQPERIKQMHRLQTVSEILHTPGIITKFKLIFREIFPENRYLQFRYGARGWRGLMKRWLRK